MAAVQLDEYAIELRLKGDLSIPLRRPERLEIFRRILSAHPDLHNRLAALWVGCSERTVNRWRRALGAPGRLRASGACCCGETEAILGARYRSERASARPVDIKTYRVLPTACLEGPGALGPSTS